MDCIANTTKKAFLNGKELGNSSLFASVLKNFYNSTSRFLGTLTQFNNKPDKGGNV